MVRWAKLADSPPSPFPDPIAAPSVVSRALRRLAAAFTYRDFRVLWLGAFTSSIGTWMQSVAQNWLVLTLTSSAFYLGLDAFLGQLPIMLFTLIGGVVADRQRSAPPAADVTVHPDDHRLHPCGAGLLGCRPRLAHPDAVVRHRLRAGVRRPGLPVAHPVAGPHEG